MSRPLITDVWYAVIVPAATPVWMGFEPVYRKAVLVDSVVATVRLSAGATVAGSGGSPPCVAARRVTLRTIVVTLPAESVATTVMALLPVTSATDALNAPPLAKATAPPFTVTRTAD